MQLNTSPWSGREYEFWVFEFPIVFKPTAPLPGEQACAWKSIDFMRDRLNSKFYWWFNRFAEDVVAGRIPLLTGTV